MATTPRQVIDSVVGSVCGHAVEQLVRLTGGGMNETYRVELAAADPVVVRIARQSVPWFTDEEHIMAQARAVGVPTPEVLGVEHVEHDGALLSFSIQRLLPGRSLDELAGELPAVDLVLLGCAGAGRNWPLPAADGQCGRYAPVGARNLGGTQAARW